MPAALARNVPSPANLASQLRLCPEIRYLILSIVGVDRRPIRL